MTVKEVLQLVISNLESIRVPVSMIQEIGSPLSISVNNLKECIKAMEMHEAEKTEEEPKEEPNE